MKELSSNEIVGRCPRNSLFPAIGTIVIVGNLPSALEAVLNVPEMPETQPAPEQESEQLTGREARRIKHQCKAARREFLDYVKNLDRDIFAEACGKTPNLKQLNDVIRNETHDLAAILAVTDIFKDIVNETIMEKIVRLKSMMT